MKREILARIKETSGMKTDTDLLDRMSGESPEPGQT
jgi:hypothetical protein